MALECMRPCEPYSKIPSIVSAQDKSLNMLLEVKPMKGSDKAIGSGRESCPLKPQLIKGP